MIELYLDTLVYMIYELDLYEYHYMTSTYIGNHTRES